MITGLAAGRVLTAQNEVYMLSESKKYSNGSHFKKIETEYKIAKQFRYELHFYEEKPSWYDDRYSNCSWWLTTDNRILGLYNNEFIDVTEDVKEKFDEVTIGEYMDNFLLDFRFPGNDPSDFGHYVDNKLLSSENEVIYSFPQGENILFVSGYMFDSLTGDIIIQTTKGFYDMDRIIEQEFADSEPVTTYKVKFISDKLEDMFLKHYFNYYNTRSAIR